LVPRQHRDSCHGRKISPEAITEWVGITAQFGGADNSQPQLAIKQFHTCFGNLGAAKRRLFGLSAAQA
jgi:hypothetical protein